MPWRLGIKTRNLAEIAVLWTFLLIGQASFAQGNDVLRKEIIDHMTLPHYSETDVQATIAKWGKDATPILLDLLERRQSTEKVIFYLGKTGSRDAVQPIIDYIVEDRQSIRAVRWGYHALGWLGFPEGIAFLLKETEDPSTRERALIGLECASSRDALDQIDAALPNVADDLKAPIETIANKIEEKLRDADALDHSRKIKPAGGILLAAFWRLQQSYPNENLSRDLVGEFEGTAYSANHSGLQQTDITIRFDHDGTFRTNLPNLISGLSRDAIPTAGAARAGQAGKYRVVSPTQLIMGAGKRGISTVAPSLRDGVLVFFNVPAQIMVVARKKGESIPPPQKYAPSDIAGAYTGVGVTVDPRRQPNPPAHETLEIVLTDAGGFVPSWLDHDGKRSVLAHNTYRGNYLLDPSGKMVIHSHFGGYDYVGTSMMPVFDWYLDGVNLHTTAFDWNGSSHLVVTIDGSVPKLGMPSNYDDLTRGAFHGTAFRVTDQGEVREFPNVSFQFDRDGTYHSNLSETLRTADDQYYPDDAGSFRLASPRHLLLGELWEGEKQEISDAVTDFQLSGDSLCFTSPRRRAYFVLTRE